MTTTLAYTTVCIYLNPSCTALLFKLLDDALSELCQGINQLNAKPITNNLDIAPPIEPLWAAHNHLPAGGVQPKLKQRNRSLGVWVEEQRNDICAVLAVQFPIHLLLNKGFEMSCSQLPSQ